jgi:Na+-transporting NADH:ubiquinone oxidoreductase subunit NqrB
MDDPTSMPMMSKDESRAVLYMLIAADISLVGIVAYAIINDNIHSEIRQRVMHTIELVVHTVNAKCGDYVCVSKCILNGIVFPSILVVGILASQVVVIALLCGAVVVSVILVAGVCLYPCYAMYKLNQYMNQIRSTPPSYHDLEHPPPQPTPVSFTPIHASPTSVSHSLL